MTTEGISSHAGAGCPSTTGKDSAVPHCHIHPLLQCVPPSHWSHVPCSLSCLLSWLISDLVTKCLPPARSRFAASIDGPITAIESFTYYSCKWGKGGSKFRCCSQWQVGRPTQHMQWVESTQHSIMLEKTFPWTTKITIHQELSTSALLLVVVTVLAENNQRSSSACLQLYCIEVRKLTYLARSGEQLPVKSLPGWSNKRVSTSVWICSYHFVKGKPVSPYKHVDPDWAPSLKFRCERRHKCTRELFSIAREKQTEGGSPETRDRKHKKVETRGSEQQGIASVSCCYWERCASTST